jgi:chaperonin cofactor prefoldin
MELSQAIKNSIKNIQSLDKEIVGIEQQLNQARQAIIEMKNLIKYYKKNRGKYLQAIVGGNLIRPLSNQDTIDTLEKRFKQVKISVDSLEEQKSHREDQLMEEYLKLHDYLEDRIPAEYLSDDEEDADN